MEAKLNPLMLRLAKSGTARPQQVEKFYQVTVQNTHATAVGGGGATTEKTLDEVVGSLNQHVQSARRALVFTIDEKLGRPIVSVIDKETGELIRQIPSEVALRIADHLDEIEDTSGMLVSERA